jgi:hypothetical protein
MHIRERALIGRGKTRIPLSDREPVANGAREIWVTATALTTALNMSFMAEQLANLTAS